MAEIVPVVSESLEAKIRQLLPSQRGFGEDLQASNVIMPIIDLTSAAESAATGQNLQTAINFGGITSFDISGATGTLMNTPGFWQLRGYYIGSSDSGVSSVGTISMTDGLTVKQVFEFGVGGTSSATIDSSFVDFVFFLRAGESISSTMAAAARFAGVYQQIADVNGNLVSPVGFTPQ